MEIHWFKNKEDQAKYDEEGVRCKPVRRRQNLIFISEMGHSFICVDLSTFPFVLLRVFRLNL